MIEAGSALPSWTAIDNCWMSNSPPVLLEKSSKRWTTLVTIHLCPCFLLITVPSRFQDRNTLPKGLNSMESIRQRLVWHDLSPCLEQTKEIPISRLRSYSRSATAISNLTAAAIDVIRGNVTSYLTLVTSPTSSIIASPTLTIRYDSVYLTCSKKLTGCQLSLSHGINKKNKMWN